LNPGDFVLRKNEERNQTKLDPKFRGLFVRDRYTLKTLDGKRSYKDSHDRLRKMPDSCVPAELDVCGGDSDDDNNDGGAPVSEDH
jgi:hypothetical protein